MRIGLPRALSYYEYAPLWRAFFEALGAEVVVSRPTSRSTLAAAARASADLCFPVKVYAGHLLQLAEEVDLVFVPSLRRPAPAATHCASIVGLPDLARALLAEPAKVLAVDIDLNEGRLALAQAVFAAARPLTWNPLQIARAADTAWGRHQAARRRRVAGRALEHIDSGPRGPGDHPESLTLAVVGHPYLLRDEYVNQRLLQRLEGLGARLLTPDTLPEGAAEQGVQDVTGAAYWAYAPDVMGAGACFLESDDIDGLVAAIAFGCAPDSGLAPELARVARQRGVPMLTLTLDEHSGEAGLVTRLEAFVDMLERKRLRI